MLENDMKKNYSQPLKIRSELVGFHIVTEEKLVVDIKQIALYPIGKYSFSDFFAGRTMTFIDSEKKYPIFKIMNTKVFNHRPTVRLELMEEKKESRKKNDK